MVAPQAGGTNAGVSYVVWDEATGGVLSVRNLRHQNNGDSVPRSFTYSDSFTIQAGQYVTFSAYVQETSPHDEKVVNSERIPDAMQNTITGSPLTGTVTLGTDFGFTVTGNHTPLQFSRAGVYVALSANSYGVALDSVGTHIFHCYAVAADGYQQSNTITFTVKVVGYRISIKLPANTTGYMVRYDVVQNGNFITSAYQVKDAAEREVYVEVPTSDPATVTPYIVGVTKDDALWEEKQGAETQLSPTIVQPHVFEDPNETSPVEVVDNGKAPAPKPADETKSVWSKTDPEGINAKDKTIKEGSDKIVSKLDEINQTLKNRLGPGTGGSAGDPNAQAITNAAGAGQGATDGNGNGNGSGEARSSTQSSFGASRETPSSFAVPSGSSSGLSVSGFGMVLNLDPLADSFVSSLASFCRGVITYVFAAIMMWWAWGEFSRVVDVLVHSQQAKGNAVIGGTGAQATALVAAAAITGILIAVPALYWAFAATALPSLPADSGPLGIAFYLFRAFVPVEFLTSAAVTAFVIRKAGVVLVATTSTLIRFVVP